MNLKIYIFLLILVIIWANSVNAQSTNEKISEEDQSTDENISTKVRLKDQIINDLYDGNWSIGVGVNVVDDSGNQFKDFNTSENWNFSQPLTICVEYYHDVFVSFALMLSFNEYIAGKNIDYTGYVIEDHEASYMAVDFATKFYFRDFFYPIRFDPYGFLGFGYTKIGAYKSEPFENNILRDDLDHIAIDENGYLDIPDIGRITINGGIGFNFWFTRIWAFNFNITAKFGIGSSEHERGPNSVSDQLQYSIGTHFLIF